MDNRENIEAAVKIFLAKNFSKEVEGDLEFIRLRHELGEAYASNRLTQPVPEEAQRVLEDARNIVGSALLYEPKNRPYAEKVILYAANLLEQTLQRVQVLEGELRAVDDRLDRRPALADIKDRASKVEHACTVAGKADRLERDCEKYLAALQEVEQNCPCGARPETPNTHPHVLGCPVGIALHPKGKKEDLITQQFVTVGQSDVAMASGAFMHARPSDAETKATQLERELAAAKGRIEKLERIKDAAISGSGKDFRDALASLQEAPQGKEGKG